MKAGFWRRDWFAGLVFSLLFLIAGYLLFPAALGSIERMAYDWGLALNDRAPPDNIAVIAIDDQSIENLGRWPWPRNLHADMIDRLTRGGAKVIGNTIFYSEPQADPGQQELSKIVRFFSGTSLPSEAIKESRELARMLEGQSGPVARMYDRSAIKNQLPKDLSQLAGLLLRAQRNLDADRYLAESYERSGNVVQAFSLEPGFLRGRPDPLPDTLRRTRIPIDREVEALPALRIRPTIDKIAAEAAGQGHLTSLLDVDGALRYEPLAARYFDEYYPSFALAIAAAALNLEPQDIHLSPGRVELGGLSIDTTPDLRMFTHFYREGDNGPAFPIDSFFDVLVENIPAEKYRDKIVILGATATGVGDRLATPIAGSTAPAEVLAHTVASILGEDFYVQPAWALWVTLGSLLLVTLWLCLGLPALSAGIAATISLVLFLGLVLADVLLLASNAMWVPLMAPAVMLALGHLLLTIKSLDVTERLRASSEMESSESNRMLGLAFQSQGQLDMAFEKFRKCPLDEQVLDPLYNLALDYERKRQFNKAISVYEHIGSYQADFRDVAARVERARKLSDTVMLGGTVGAGTLMMSGEDLEKPMLGRYEVQKELGKGAMGVVYLGKDPKIGRTVAIKTMALAQEFEADELDDVKDRFFREAETAGRLTHPNIVTIYDAGEEHDLAYIAMEFISGYDLTRHVKYDNLLDPQLVLRIIADSADALGYAHGHGIVHRDIKPANLMWLPDTKVVKVTDFGIARLADSSKTKTGMVLGTPSYMSPEQLAGKKVDGRSDLFSLGVSMYQLLTGRLPFSGDSMATLMFKIANEAHQPPSTHRPDLDSRIDEIMDHLLSKDLESRYADGAALARDLRELIR